jgi:hypothetical protein
VHNTAYGPIRTRNLTRISRSIEMSAPTGSSKRQTKGMPILYVTVFRINFPFSVIEDQHRSGDSNAKSQAKPCLRS